MCRIIVIVISTVITILRCRCRITGGPIYEEIGLYDSMPPITDIDHSDKNKVGCNADSEPFPLISEFEAMKHPSNSTSDDVAGHSAPDKYQHLTFRQLPDAPILDSAHSVSTGEEEYEPLLMQTVLSTAEAVTSSNVPEECHHKQLLEIGPILNGTAEEMGTGTDSQGYEQVKIYDVSHTSTPAPNLIVDIYIYMLGHSVQVMVSHPDTVLIHAL